MTVAAIGGPIGKQLAHRTINKFKSLDIQGVGRQRHNSSRRAQGAIGKKRKAASGARGLVTGRPGSGTVTGVCATPTPRPALRAARGAYRAPPQRPDQAVTGRTADGELMVGSAQETDAMHAERHPLCQIDQWAKICPRCFFVKWKRTHQTPPWLKSKPCFMSGAWGLG